ncbi:hypothetical protein D7231_20195 [Streptomyces klenkii]|uniref:Uncharacterized protein n=1 Tax=Streptomyces klenkii TaxID=1420899 RepID=A0A3B0B948_9ACTN|nr:hypothetical protein [Streptomyces klenkii]RKN70213.1 hypothetical protein D7231_20195 [Streptomyces klenkii]
MRIEISQIVNADIGEVEFISPVGTARGIWKGTQAPHLGSHDVELDLPEAIHAWEAAGAPFESIGTDRLIEGHRVMVSGKVEIVGEDSVLSLRIGSDIVLVELGTAESPEEGSAIRFTTPSIELYPYQV